jgi:hypothetical protein
MNSKKIKLIALAAVSIASFSACGRNIRLAKDITPANSYCEKMDWRYGASDIKIQTTNVTKTLMDRWYWKSAKAIQADTKPRIVITEIDNRTDMYISTDMIRDVIEGVAVNDGRFTIVVGDSRDEHEMDQIMHKIRNDPKYNNSSRLEGSSVKAPQFLGKVRITKAVNSDRHYDYEDYRMTITLYDLETQELVDSAWDVLKKKVQA